MFFINDLQVDTLAADATANGTGLLQDVGIDCIAGTSLFCEAVPDLTVEAKHSASGTWIDIETMPIDLTPWDGTRQIFNLRFTPTAVKGIFAFRFQIGLTDVNANLIVFGSEPVFFGIESLKFGA